MKRVLVVLAALAALPSCQSGRRAPATAPSADHLRAYVGQHRILRGQGDRDRITLEKGDAAPISGACDVAVVVRSAALDKGAPLLVLDTLGDASTERSRSRCKEVPAAITLRVGGLESAPAGQVTARLDQLVPTPEAYLRARGIAFDLAPAPEPAVAGAVEGRSNTTDDERRLGRRVTAPPRKLLWVDPVYRNPRVHHEAEVEFELVVGADGRVYRPQVKGGLGKEHVAAIHRALAAWRFEPARAGQEPIPVYHSTRAVFRIY
jgi:hypothetical protein